MVTTRNAPIKIEERYRLLLNILSNWEGCPYEYLKATDRRLFAPDFFEDCADCRDSETPYREARDACWDMFIEEQIHRYKRGEKSLICGIGEMTK